MVFVTSKGSDQPCAYVQTDQSICLSLEYSMTVKLLTEHHLEFLCLTGGCTDSSESTLVKMPHCWKSRVVAHIPSSLGYLQSVKVPLKFVTVLEQRSHHMMVAVQERRQRSGIYTIKYHT